MQPTTIKALLVEDNPGDASLLRLSLRGLSTQVDLQHVECLAAGIARLQADPPEVLLLDLNLPDSRGMETVSSAQQAAPQVPIIVMTSGDDEAAGMEAIGRGAQDYILKGQADGRQVLRAIRYALERKRGEVALRQANDLLELRVRQRTAELESSVTILGEEVGERTRAEREARDVQDQFRQMADALPAVFWMVTADLSQVLYVNQAYEAIWGRPCQSLYEQPRSWREAVHEDDRQRIVSAIEQYVQHSRLRRMPPICDAFRVIRTGGEVMLVLAQAAAVYDSSEQLRYFVGMVQSQDSIAQTCVDEAVIRVGPDGLVRAWNHDAEKLFGLQAAKAIGLPLSLHRGEGALSRLLAFVGRSKR